MQTIRTIALLSVASIAVVAAPLGGCEKESEPAKPAAGASKPVKADDHAHEEGDGHDHDQPAAGKPADSHDGHDHGHDDGPTTELGEQSVGGFMVKASRDGDITPGMDAAIDVWVTGGTAKVVAVRFWIGTEDAKGSVKAKAEIERDNWHTHAEIPNPIPAGSKLWIEIEDDKGGKSVGSFDLKMAG